MIVIVCVDERNGMMFNHRRQSRDSLVCRDIFGECAGKKLYMSVYSGKLFEEMDGVQIEISEDFLKQAGKEDVCFVEDMEMSGFEDQIQEVIVYKWNRRYPADRYFSVDLSDGAWELIRTEEFEGSSHERITKEVYKRIR